MLDAGAARAVDASVHDFLSFLRPDDIAGAVDRSKSTFFHHWPTLQAYLDDLVRHAVNPMTDTGLARRFGDIIADDGADSAETLARLRRLGADSFEALLVNPNFPFLLLSSAATIEPAVRGELQDANRELETYVAGIIEDYLTRRRLVLRDPFTADVVVSALMAIILGLAMRGRGTPERFTGTLFVDVVAGLLSSLVAGPPSRDMTFDDYIDNALIHTDAASPKHGLAARIAAAPEDVREMSAGVTATLREEVVPAAEAALAAAMAETGGGIESAVGYFARLHGILEDHQYACVVAIGIGGAIRIGGPAPGMANPALESGLDGVTRRAVACTPALATSPHIEATAVRLQLDVMRMVIGADTSPLPRFLDVVRAILELDA